MGEVTRGDRAPGVLRRRVLWRTLAATLMVAMVALLVHSALLIAHQRAEDRQSVESTLDMLMPNVVRAAWQINEGGMKALLTSLAARPDVRWVRYSDAQQQQLVPPDADPAAPCTDRIGRSLAGQTVGAQTLDGGDIVLCYAPRSWTSALGGQLWQAIIPLLLLAVAAIYPAWTIRRSVLRPIEDLTRSLRGDTSVLDITLDRPAADRGDEVDRLLEELQHRTRRFLHERGMAELAFRSLRDGMVITDEQFVVLRANPAVERVLPGGARLVAGTRLADHLPRNVLDRLDGPVDFKTADNRVIEVEASRLDRDGERPLWAFVLSDLTLRRQYESNVLQSHKMNALGTLSGGVAHDFNNLLMAIAGNAELLGMTEPLSEEGRTMVAAIRHAARRGSGLTAQLLTFARKQPLKPTVLDLAAVCQEVLSLSRRTLGPSHPVQLTLEPGLRVKADATFLETALLNLLVNARDAQPEGGPIGLSGSALRMDGQDFVRLSVVNGGPAIEPAVLSRMGEPFFTTKAHGKGTGLGLSMVMGFAQQSGGRVQIESVPGRTSVSLVLPHEPAPDPAAEAAAAVGRAALDQRALRVLVVDDDALVLKVTGGLVASLGHWVTPVASVAAVAALLRDDPRWDVVLCDVALGDGSGLDIHDLMHRQGLHPAFIFVTGNVPEPLLDRLQQVAPHTVLHKPFDRETLRQLLEPIALHGARELS